jgi:hypothetical protein
VHGHRRVYELTYCSRVTTRNTSSLSGSDDARDRLSIPSYGKGTTSLLVQGPISSAYRRDIEFIGHFQNRIFETARGR